jgi:uncharacterized phage protein (TIGR02220 family)
MQKVTIPIQFFDALKKQPPIYRLMWIEWLSQGEKVLDPRFSENLRYDRVPREKITECYAIGIELLREGISFIEPMNHIPDPWSGQGLLDSKKPNKADINAIAIEIVEYLNKKANTQYKPKSGTTIQLISGRLSEGFTKEDFFKVIDNKVEHWKNTEQEQYLRPITLFSKSKFESYLNQPRNGTKKSTSSIDQVRNAVKEAKSKLFD